MRRFILFICFLIFAATGHTQLSNSFDLEFTCLSQVFPVFTEGRYTKYEGTLSPYVSGLPNAGCGCYNKEGTNDFLLVESDAGRYFFKHYVEADGGCASSTMEMYMVESLENPSETCIPTDFNTLSGAAINASSCTEYTLSPVISESIPTLSEWGLIP